MKVGDLVEFDKKWKETMRMGVGIILSSHSFCGRREVKVHWLSMGEETIVGKSYLRPVKK
jgi:hypothetical protein|tara:strand:+ start:1402 stop:1581 length:180 start_codon:yes stop_codon:yes gene_type:complete